MQLKVSINKIKNNIYLEVDEKPSEQLSLHLKEFSGFKSTSNPKKWWAKHHPSYLWFSHELESKLNKNLPFTNILLKPSYKANLENLEGFEETPNTEKNSSENRKYSFITYTFLFQIYQL